MAIVATFDGVDSDTITGLGIDNVVRPLAGEVRDNYEYIPGRESAWLFAEEPGDRVIVVNCWIDSDSKPNRRTALRETIAWCLSTDRKELVFSDEPNWYWDAKLVQAPTPEEAMYFGKFALSFRCGPYAYATSSSTETWTTVGSPSSHTWSISDEVAAFPVITVTANADIDSFYLTVNGRMLFYNAPLANGDSITFSSINYLVLTGVNADINLTGAFDISDVDMAYVSGDFGNLEPGSNTIVFTPTNAATADIEVAWRRRYL